MLTNITDVEWVKSHYTTDRWRNSAKQENTVICLWRRLSPTECCASVCTDFGTQVRAVMRAVNVTWLQIHPMTFRCCPPIRWVILFNRLFFICIVGVLWIIFNYMWFFFVFNSICILTPQVFVLMQFDPGLEYKPPSVRRAANNSQGSGVGGGGSNKDDNSWLLLCSALTDGPYSYIWTQQTHITMLHNMVAKFHSSNPSIFWVYMCTFKL